MAELEKEMHCENCGSKCHIIYDSEQVHYTPENCPFCGENLIDYDVCDEDDFMEMSGDEENDDYDWN